MKKLFIALVFVAACVLVVAKLRKHFASKETSQRQGPQATLATSGASPVQVKVPLPSRAPASLPQPLLDAVPKKILSLPLLRLPEDLRSQSEMRVFLENDRVVQARLFVDGVRVEASEVAFVRGENGDLRPSATLPTIRGLSKSFPSEVNVEKLQEQVKKLLISQANTIEKLAPQGKLWVVNDEQKLDPVITLDVDYVGAKNRHLKEVWYLDPESGQVKARSGRGRF
jgi:hypothetical protein